MHNYEINYVPEPGAVSQVTGYSCEQERASSQDAIIVSRIAQKIIKHCHSGRDGQHNKEPSSKTSAFLQLTKSDSPILRVNKIEEAANDGPIGSESQRAHRPRLAGLINHVDAKAGEQVTRAPAQAQCRSLSILNLAHSVASRLGLKRGSLLFNFFQSCHTPFANIRVTG